jgi:hypothetical protein
MINVSPLGLHGPEGMKHYSCTLSLTSALDGGDTFYVDILVGKIDSYGVNNIYLGAY